MAKNQNTAKRKPVKRNQIFLGGISVDEGGTTSALPAEFARLVDAYSDAMSRYHDGAVGLEDTARRLQGLRILDDMGGEWTLGATTMKWYRRTEGMPWVQHRAPTMAAQPVVLPIEFSDPSVIPVASEVRRTPVFAAPTHDDLLDGFDRAMPDADAGLLAAEDPAQDLFLTDFDSIETDLAEPSTVTPIMPVPPIVPVPPTMPGETGTSTPLDLTAATFGDSDTSSSGAYADTSFGVGAFDDTAAGTLTGGSDRVTGQVDRFDSPSNGTSVTSDSSDYVAGALSGLFDEPAGAGAGRLLPGGDVAAPATPARTGFDDLLDGAQHAGPSYVDGLAGAELQDIDIAQLLDNEPAGEIDAFGRPIERPAAAPTPPTVAPGDSWGFDDDNAVGSDAVGSATQGTGDEQQHSSSSGTGRDTDGGDDNGDIDSGVADDDLMRRLLGDWP